MDVSFGGYRPGAIGRITELHGAYYKEHWGFDLFFEAKVATELSAFLNQFDEKRDGFWIATVEGRITGSVAIVGEAQEAQGARLRWFIVDSDYQGQGLGRLLMEKAVDFCRQTGFRRVYLTTFAGLDAARRLYDRFGFTLCAQQEDNHWGKRVIEQEFELRLF